MTRTGILEDNLGKDIWKVLLKKIYEDFSSKKGTSHVPVTQRVGIF